MTSPDIKYSPAPPHNNAICLIAVPYYPIYFDFNGGGSITLKRADTPSDLDDNPSVSALEGFKGSIYRFVKRSIVTYPEIPGVREEQRKKRTTCTFVATVLPEKEYFDLVWERLKFTEKFYTGLKPRILGYDSENNPRWWMKDKATGKEFLLFHQRATIKRILYCIKHRSTENAFQVRASDHKESTGHDIQPFYLNRNYDPEVPYFEIEFPSLNYVLNPAKSREFFHDAIKPLVEEMVAVVPGEVNRPDHCVDESFWNAPESLDFPVSRHYPAFWARNIYVGAAHNPIAEADRFLPNQRIDTNLWISYNDLELFNSTYENFVNRLDSEEISLSYSMAYYAVAMHYLKEALKYIIRPLRRNIYRIIPYIFDHVFDIPTSSYPSSSGDGFRYKPKSDIYGNLFPGTPEPSTDYVLRKAVADDEDGTGSENGDTPIVAGSYSNFWSAYWWKEADENEDYPEPPSVSAVPVATIIHSDEEVELRLSSLTGSPSLVYSEQAGNPVISKGKTYWRLEMPQNSIDVEGELSDYRGFFGGFLGNYVRTLPHRMGVTVDYISFKEDSRDSGRLTSPLSLYGDKPQIV